jgi:transposase
LSLSHEERTARRYDLAEYVKEHGLFKAMKKFQVCRQTVEGACAEHDVPIREIINHAERKKQREAAAELCRTKTLSEVCTETWLSDATVRAACREFGVELKKEPKKEPKKAPHGLKTRSFAILKLLLDGNRQVDIAREFDVSRQYVEQVRDKGVEAGFVFDGGK